MMFAKFFVDITSAGIYNFHQLFWDCKELCYQKENRSFLAPFVTSVLHPVNLTLPYIILLDITILASGGGAILPETNLTLTRDLHENAMKTFVKHYFVSGNIEEPNNEDRMSWNIQLISKTNMFDIMRK